MTAPTLGTVLYAFFTEYLADQKGLRPTIHPQLPRRIAALPPVRDG